MDKKQSLNDGIARLKKLYKVKRRKIIERLACFRKARGRTDEEIFSELCFCILTPRSKAEICDEIIDRLKKNSFLFKADIDKIRPYLKKARFYRNKSRYIVEARKFFQRNGRIRIKDRLCAGDIRALRDWLVDNIKGLGLKEASHFLRNIGLGENIAILDVHILRNLKRYGVIDKLPESLTKNRYLEIEERLKRFSNRVKIPMAHLDLLFWSLETGKIFK